MKRILFTLLFVTLLLSSCGKKDNTNVNANENDTFEEALRKAEERNADENQNQSGNGNDSNEQGNISYSPQDEILNAEISERKIQIGNTVLQLPTTYEAITNAGAVFSNTSVSEIFLMEPKQKKMATMHINNASMTITFYNPDNEQKELKDSSVIEISVSKGSDVFGLKGVTIGTKLDELKNILSEPDYIKTPTLSQFTYCYYETPLYLERFEENRQLSNFFSHGSENVYSTTQNDFYFEIDRNTQEVISFRLTINSELYNGEEVHVSDFTVSDKYNFKTPEGTENTRRSSLYTITGNDVLVFKYFRFNSYESLMGSSMGVSDEELVKKLLFGKDVYTKVLYNDAVKSCVIGYTGDKNLVDARVVARIDEDFQVEFNCFLFAFDPATQLEDNSLADFEKMILDMINSVTVQ